MAQVAQQTELRIRVDHYLDYLMMEWAAIPELAAEWAEWEEYDRLGFVLEWPIREDRLLQLQGWSAEGLLSAPQQRHYEDLQALMRRHRPLLAQLLAD